MQFLIATTNPGKVKEFREMLGSDRFDWMSLSDLPALPEVEETGFTFRANAVLKASSYARSTGHWTMADDSGLEVDALDKKPGIYSARWAQMHDAGKGDAANNALLLSQLTDTKQGDRSARFVCVLAVADPQGRIILTTRATMEGTIGLAPVGTNGFGYDPLFQVRGMQCTSAELAPAEKHRISHRGQALERMKQLLKMLPL
jgi:XTP/dITP diphosphohydrolase